MLTAEDGSAVTQATKSDPRVANRSPDCERLPLTIAAAQSSTGESMSSQKRPVLLCDGGYYGTLAAARTLGLNDVPVLVAGPNMLAPALWSRHLLRNA